MTSIVDKGVVSIDSAYQFVVINATDAELHQLSKCEHPILRSTAFRIMMDRPSIDHFDLIMHNLSDSAVVTVDAGEWGTEFYTVSHELLEIGKWKDRAARTQTIEELLKNHQNLRAAYEVLPRIEMKREYYPYVLQMSLVEDDSDQERPLRLDRINFRTREYALLALAGFRNKKDIAFIKRILLENSGSLNEISYQLMREYPDSSYMDVFEDALFIMYRKLSRGDESLLGKYFIDALAAQRNERAAALISKMLNRKPFLPCPTGKRNSIIDLYTAIVANPCEAYDSLRTVAEPVLREFNKSIFAVDAKPYHPPKDTSIEPVRWWHQKNK